MSLIIDWLESLSYDIEISDTCLRRLSPLSTCTSCLQSCPEKAIVLEDGHIEIDEKICSSCGICVPYCPIKAIKGQSKARTVIQKYLLLQKEETIPSFIELLYFHKKGVRVLYHSSPNQELEQQAKIANEYLEAMRIEPLIITDQLELQQKPPAKLTRRDFFSKITSDSKKTVLSSITPVKWRFNEESFRLPALYKEWTFYKVKISKDSCTLCQACFNLCPENVFNLAANELAIDEQKCAGCHLCEDICQSSAIQIEKNIHKGHLDPLPLLHCSCTNCGCSFHSWEEKHICHICSSRAKPNFFL
jgi:Pyruvate/2-oxoacid:ferredoxin oxidoreductase delta subunit